ncbi:hypothetical protein RCC89_03680 [Cytophagaceae bacterium ABcell3]|nr:hypothetical protein RCC89_03680 [Cytophagaceae bacterium ABcell3]
METYGYSQEKTDRLIANGYDVTPSDYIKQGWGIFKQNFGGFVGYMVIVLLVNIVLDSIPGIGFLLSAILQGPLLAGFYIVSRKIQYNETYTFSDFFNGFKNFVPLAMVNLIGGLLILIGLVLLVLPGVYLLIAYLLGTPFVVFGKMDFWPALENSRKLITKQWFSFFAFALLLVLINILGAIAFGIGLLISIPVTLCATYAAYEHIIGTGHDPNTIDEEAVIVED